MAKIKNISVEIVVYKYTTKKLFDILKDEIDKISDRIDGIDIDLVIDYQKDNDIWDKEKTNFNLLDSIPFIMAIKEIWVPKDYRKQGVGTSILSIITSVFGKESLIFAYASMIEKEYPALKYTANKDDHDGRKLVDKVQIFREEMTFLAKRGFLEVSAYTNADMNKSIMLFGGPIGILAKEYMECYIVTMNRHGHNRINRIYRELFYQSLGFADDSDAIMYPWLFDQDQKINPSIDDDTKEAIKDKPWYSGYEGEDTSVKDCATRNRDVLTLIGGAEVEVEGNPDDAVWVGYNCIYFHINDEVKNTKYYATDYSHLCYNEETDEYDFDKLTEEDKKNEKFPSQRFQDEEDTSIVLMRGYALCNDGIWRERLWYYDTEEKFIIEEVETMVEKSFPLAYVGYLCQVQSEL